jgi:DNA-directed RNA polymerase subunit RPC12/RpoP
MVQMVEIACPRCGSTVSHAGVGGTFQCAHCETRFLVAQAAGGARSVTIVQAGGARVGVVAAVACLVVVAAGTAGFLAMRAPASEAVAARPVRVEVAARDGGQAATVEKSEKIEKIEKIEASAAAAAPPPPQATLEGTRHGKTSIGGEFWLTTYVNSGEVAIEGPAAVVSMFDETDRRVGEETGYAVASVLAPGDKVPLMVLAAKPPKYARVEVAPAPPRPRGYSAAPLPMKVREMSVQAGSFGRPEAVGTVVNEGDAAAAFTKVTVIGRSSSGEMVSYASGFATTTSAIAPGEESGFKISMGTWEVEEPATYEAFALAQSAR